MSGHGSEHKSKFATFVEGVSGFSTLAIARGTTFFVAVYTFLSAVAGFRTPGSATGLWWIDFSFLPNVAALVVGIACSAAMFCFGVWPKMASWRRLLTATAGVVLAAAAFLNVVDFYRSWSAGEIRYAVPLPFSLVLGVVFVLLTWAALALSSEEAHTRDHFAALFAFLLIAALFPLVQMVFFGTTSHRAKADAAVLFGPRVYDKGKLKAPASDRVATAVDLYQGGYVRTLIIAGGKTASGVDESSALRDAAVQAGVPSSAILLDTRATNTATVVRDTVTIFEKRGIKDVIAVSQSYELPRIKLAYLAVGWDVRTVPAKLLSPTWKKPQLVLQEVPGFWDYWSRTFMRDLQGR